MTTALLDGRCALVVGGGGGGIGTSVCTTLAAAGADVAIADIWSEGAHAAVERVSQAGGRAVAIRADVSDTDSIDAMLHQAWEQLGALDVLVTVVGGIRTFGLTKKPVHELVDAEIDRAFDLNVGYVFRVVRVAIGLALAHDRPVSIVGVSSIAGGPSGAPQMSTYGAAKAALNSLARSVAVEYGRHGVRMNVVAPGFVETPVSKPPSQNPIESTVPIGRAGAPQDIANVVLFFASPLASYVSGQMMAVDGGATCRFPI